MALLDREAIVSALEEIVDGLILAGISARLKLVGGAALAIQYYDRPATTDVDGHFSPAEAVQRIADDVGATRGWPGGWLNDKAQAFFSHYDSDDDWHAFITAGDVVVLVASPQLLLAMKLHAGRGQRDGLDIEKLLDLCAPASMRELEELFDSYYPHDEMKPAAQRRALSWFERTHPAAE
jgi:hypothetical protein